MWYCGATDLAHRDAILSFAAPYMKRLRPFAQGSFHEGFRPVPKGVSKFLFITRDLSNTRTEEAFLTFKREGRNAIQARSPMGATYQIGAGDLRRTLRTPVGLATMNISGLHDYVADRPYRELDRVVRAAGFARSSLDWGEFWAGVSKSLDATKTRLVVCHRINPFSPALHLVAFYSEEEVYPSNQMNVILEADPIRAKALCALINSAAFLAQFLLLKEESTGRYINIRFYDLEAMRLAPPPRAALGLANVFDRFGGRDFPPLRYQLDANFDERYRELHVLERKGQLAMFPLLGAPVKPAGVRLAFDIAVARALGLRVSRKELTALYSILVQEMMLTQGLRRD
jgi:hypothetical protein